MCDGGPLDCPQSNHARCPIDDTTWKVADTTCPGKCPECGEVKTIVIDRCAACPLTQIEDVRVNSDAGSLLDRVLDLEFSIDKFGVTWDDVTVEECKALQILHSERAKHSAEVADQDRQNGQFRANLHR